MVLDAHTHAWGPPTRAHPWVNDDLARFLDLYDVSVVYEAGDLVGDMQAAGVDEAILVPFPLVEWTDNSYIVESVAAHDALVGGIVMLDVFADDAPDRLRELMANEEVLGIRLGTIYPRDRMWQDAAFDPTEDWLLDAIEETAFWAAARETDAFVQVFAHRDQLEQVVALADAYPELSIAVDHLAHADPATPPDEGGFATFADLAERSNVAVKLSEVPFISETPFPYRDLHDHVRWLIDRFGRERCIWGSDFPNISRTATYADGLTWLEHVDALSERDRTWLTGRAFREHVGL